MEGFSVDADAKEFFWFLHQLLEAVIAWIWETGVKVSERIFQPNFNNLPNNNFSSSRKFPKQTSSSLFSRLKNRSRLNKKSLALSSYRRVN